MSKNFENFIPPVFTPELQQRVADELGELAAMRDRELGFNGRSYIHELGAQNPAIRDAGHALATAANTTEHTAQSHRANVAVSRNNGWVRS